MPRTYVQRARAEASAATQTRLIEAARELLVEGEVPRLDISLVAERAGVARSTVYLSFGTRSAFLKRILDDSLNRAGFSRLRELLTLPDAREAMEDMLAMTALMYAADEAILRRMLLLARLDQEVEADHQLRQARRSEAMRDLARRLHRQGQLRPEISVDNVASILWVLTSFDTFDQLFSGWGLSARACGARLVTMGRSALLQPSV